MLNLRKPDSPAATPLPSATQSILDRYPTPDTGRTQMNHAADNSTVDGGPTDFVIGRGTKLKGEIDAQGDVIVEGEVEASIRADTMRLEAGGSVKGETHVTNAEISGRYEGTIQVAKCLTVRAEGHIAGSVHYGELKIDQGGTIVGDLALTEDTHTSRPQNRALTEAAPSTEQEH